MKIARFPFIFLCVISARADLTVVQNLEGSGAPLTMTIKIKGTKARVDATPQVTTIIDSQTGEILNLMLEQKKFIRISAESAKAALSMIMKDKSEATHPELKPTGKRQNIGGYEAEEYTCESPSFKASYWLSASYPDAQNIINQLRVITPESLNGMAKGLPDFRDFKGVPLRSQVDFGGHVMTNTLISIQQDPLGDEEFVTPKDFTEMKMPRLDQMLGGKSGSAKPSATPKR